VAKAGTPRSASRSWNGPLAVILPGIGKSRSTPDLQKCPSRRGLPREDVVVEEEKSVSESRENQADQGASG